jgi:hypothetical protein
MEHAIVMTAKRRDGEPATWRRPPACGVDLEVDVSFPVHLIHNEDFLPGHDENVDREVDAAGRRPAPRLSAFSKQIISPEYSNCESS